MQMFCSGVSLRGFLGLLHCHFHRMVAFDVAQLMKLVDVQFEGEKNTRRGG